MTQQNKIKIHNGAQIVEKLCIRFITKRGKILQKISNLTFDNDESIDLLEVYIGELFGIEQKIETLNKYIEVEE